MGDIAFTALIVLLVVVVSLGIAVNRLVVRRSKETTEYRVLRKFPEDSVVRSQQFSRLMARESTGPTDDDILGTLVLSNDRLGFIGIDPDVELMIPVDEITAVELRGEHLGMRTGHPLLLVSFPTETGMDTVSFNLPMTDEWQLAVRNVSGLA